MARQNKSSELARQTLLELAARKLEPNPDNYRALYAEIAGIDDSCQDRGPETVLREFTASLPRNSPGLAHLGNTLTAAVNSHDWQKVQRGLELLVDRAFAGSEHAADGAAALHVTARLYALLAETLETSISTQLIETPFLAREAASLAEYLRAGDVVDIDRLQQRFKSLRQGIELQGTRRTELQNALLDLLRLMIDNVGELVADDRWLTGQMQVVTQAITGPLSLDALEVARSNLQNVIAQQRQLKQSLSEVRSTLKQMVVSFVDELGKLSETTGDYHDSIEHLSQQIRRTDDVTQLNQLLEEVLRETRDVQASTLRSRREVLDARQKVDEAQRKAAELEAELQHVSEQVQNDYLTGTLNRRGLQEAYDRELAIAERENTPTSIALLDIDNFKELNDNFGHQVGDHVLTHLATLIKDTVRPGDRVSRYGGEEFLILLPNADIDQAIAVLTRLQRALTKHFFLHEDAPLLITFSTGVTRHLPGETQAAVIARADQALYQAKRNGKNRVIALQPEGMDWIPETHVPALGTSAAAA